MIDEFRMVLAGNDVLTIITKLTHDWRNITEKSKNLGLIAAAAPKSKPKTIWGCLLDELSADAVAGTSRRNKPDRAVVASAVT